MTTKDEDPEKAPAVAPGTPEGVKRAFDDGEGDELEDLVKMRKEQLDPIRDEIKRLEGELSLLQ